MRAKEGLVRGAARCECDMWQGGASDCDCCKRSLGVFARDGEGRVHRQRAAVGDHDVLDGPVVGARLRVLHGAHDAHPCARATVTGHTLLNYSNRK